MPKGKGTSGKPTGGKLEPTRQSDTGRNTHFRDTKSREEKSRTQVVREIEQGLYPDYHVREINGVKTPVSNPDSENNNLG